MTEDKASAEHANPAGDTPVPYDRQTRCIKPLTSMDDIRRFSEKLDTILEDTACPLRMGSIYRVSELALPNMGIELNDANRAEYANIARESHIVDEMSDGLDSDERDNVRSFRQEVGRDVIGELANYIGIMMKEAFRASYDGSRVLRICDIAAGSSHLSTAIAAALRSDDETSGLIEKVQFTIVDYTSKLERIGRNLKSLGVGVDLQRMHDERFLQYHSDEKFDFVVLSCHAHRKPMIGEYLKKLNGIMVPGGIIMSGDWHSSLQHYPAQLRVLLQSFGIENAKLKLFDDLFDPLLGETGQDRMNSEETKALQHHMEYWQQLATEVRKPAYASGRMKVRILSAFTTSCQLMKEFDKAGFETDVAKIKAAFPESRQPKLPNAIPLRVRDKSDTAAVIMGMKR